MTQAADRIFINADVRTLAEPDETHEAVAVRDGEIVRVDSEYEVEFLRGVETDVIDCEGGVLLPGFVDAHTHLEILGRRLVHADLSTAEDRQGAIDRLREIAENDDAVDDEWVLGYGYDESTWSTASYLTREELDRVSETRPVVAFREDLHVVSVNSAVLERYDLPGDHVEKENGEPTGVLTEDAAEAIRRETSPDRDEMKTLIAAARDRAHQLGVTGVHDMVRHSEAPAVYRRLDLEDELDLRVRLYYWEDHLDAVAELGLRTNHGSDFVRVGGIKTFSDGSIGARTAKLTDPYADEETTGEWTVDPESLTDVGERAEELELQLAVHAIGDRAIQTTLEVLPDAPENRHRIEHFELHPEDLSDVDHVVSMQPNFLRWAREEGFYERRLGRSRTRASNRFSDVIDANVPLAFGSDCMPLDPLYGIQQAVTAPESSQRLTVTQAIRAYTLGSAYAGFDEERLGTIEVGKRADFTVLAESPWEVDRDRIADIDVEMTIVDGEVVYRR